MSVQKVMDARHASIAEHWSSQGDCGVIQHSGVCFVCCMHLPDQFTSCKLVVAIFFLGHRYKACRHLGHQDTPIDASALQDVLSVHLAEDAHEQFSDLEAGQADVPRASTFSVGGDQTIATLMRMTVGCCAIPESVRHNHERACALHDQKKKPNRHMSWRVCRPRLRGPPMRRRSGSALFCATSSSDQTRHKMCRLRKWLSDDS